MGTERFTSLLSPGEQIRWAGRAEAGKFMDSASRKHNILWFSITGAIFLALFIAYAIACASHGTRFFSLFTAVFLMIAVVVVLDPWTTYRKVRKTVYAVTDRRILTSSSETSHFEFPLEKADDIRLLPGEDGRATVCVGSPTFSVKPSKLRISGALGYRYDEGEESTTYPIFYNVADAQQAKTVIEQCRKERLEKSGKP